jgi:hypothetical protein
VALEFCIDSDSLGHFLFKTKSNNLLATSGVQIVANNAASYPLHAVFCTGENAQAACAELHGIIQKIGNLKPST